VTAKRVRLAELAAAGIEQLFREEWRRVSLIQSVTLALGNDPTRNAQPCPGIQAQNFWLRGFFAGVEIRVLFELTDEITVWSVTLAAKPV
jgi:hypothetical protein